MWALSINEYAVKFAYLFITCGRDLYTHLTDRKISLLLQSTSKGEFLLFVLSSCSLNKDIEKLRSLDLLLFLAYVTIWLKVRN